MSDNIPFEIQAEIIQRIPNVKSLIQFRSVSKPWKALIDSPEFIADFHARHRNNRLLVRYDDLMDFKTKYVSIIDNDDDADNDSCFAQRKFPLTIPVSAANQLIDPKIFGSSKGLFCFYYSNSNSNNNYEESDQNMVVLWNPCIRKSITVDVPIVFDTSYETVIGFGVHPYSSDPTLVKIQTVADEFDFKPHQVELYSVSTGKWRSLSQDVVPRLSVGFPDDQHVVIDEFICWLAQDRKCVSNSLMKLPMVLIFNMISERFKEIYLPNNVKIDSADLSIYKLWESLAVGVYDFDLEKGFCHVWMMEGGVSRSFTKIYTISRPEEDVFKVLSFRNTGNPIIGIKDDIMGSDELYVYEPDSEQIRHIGISGDMFTCYAGSYVETLLLLDQ